PWLAGSFLAAFVVLWLAAGQALTGLPKFWNSLGAFIGSYEAVMAKEMPAQKFWFGMFYAALGLLLCAFRFGNLLRREGRRFFLSPETYHLILAGALGFLGWKLGSLRGDDSYDIYAEMMIVMIVYLALVPVGYSPGAKNIPARKFSPEM